VDCARFDSGGVGVVEVSAVEGYHERTSTGKKRKGEGEKRTKGCSHPESFRRTVLPVSRTSKRCPTSSLPSLPSRGRSACRTEARRSRRGEGRSRRGRGLRLLGTAGDGGGKGESVKGGRGKGGRVVPRNSRGRRKRRGIERASCFRSVLVLARRRRQQDLRRVTNQYERCPPAHVLVTERKKV
jgi:hypothetical protein